MPHRPSRLRRHRPRVSTELTLTPVMNLFMCLIPLLLLAAVFQNVTILNLFLPTVEDARVTEAAAVEDFTLVVTMTAAEIAVRRDDKVLWRSAVADRRMDLSGLSEALARVKETAPDKKDIVLALDGEVVYDSIVQAMDTVRAAGGRELFPDISLADRVVEAP